MSDVIYDLDDDAINLMQTAKWLALRPNKCLSNTAKFRHCQYSTEHDGMIFLVDRSTMLTIFYLEYSIEKFEALGDKPCLVEIAMWSAELDSIDINYYAIKTLSKYVLQQFHFATHAKSHTEYSKQVWKESLQIVCNETGILNTHDNTATPRTGEFDEWYKENVDKNLSRFYIRSNLA